MFYVSRLYVPYALFSLYRKGVFDEYFSFGELKHMIRIVIFMQFIDLAGHALFRYMTRPVVNKYVSENEDDSVKKKIMDDYLT